MLRLDAPPREGLGMRTRVRWKAIPRAVDVGVCRLQLVVAVDEQRVVIRGETSIARPVTVDQTLNTAPKSVVAVDVSARHMRRVQIVEDRVQSGDHLGRCAVAARDRSPFVADVQPRVERLECSPVVTYQLSVSMFGGRLRVTLRPEERDMEPDDPETWADSPETSENRDDKDDSQCKATTHNMSYRLF